jgi:hypothetical protein
MQECIRWLHISDLHHGCAGSSFLWPSVREEFYRDLAILHQRSGPWEIVFFTGDLAQTGSPPEYDALTQSLDELWERFAELGSTPLLVAIPGNHDIQRPQDGATMITDLAGWHEDRALRENFWDHPSSTVRQGVINMFQPYSNWYQDWRERHVAPFSTSTREGILPGDISIYWEKAGARVGIIGLNSTFLQISGGDFHRHLDIDVRQFHSACGGDGSRWASTCDLLFLMTHHPTDWLHPRARAPFAADISPAGRFAVHFFGHMHEPRQTFQRIGGAPTERLLQGASLFGLENYGEASEKRIHGYSAGEIMLGDEAIRLSLWPRRLITTKSGSHRMVPDYEHVLNGNDAVQDHWMPSYARKRADPLVVPQPPGAPYDEKWYVNRDEVESEALRYLDSPGKPAVLWGSKMIGKSTTLKHLLERIRRGDGDSSTLVNINVGLITTSAFASFNAFAFEFAQELALELKLDPEETSRLWRSQVPPKQKLSTLILQHLKRDASRRTVLSIDGADALLEYPVCQDFFGLLRAWADNADVQHWSRLRLLLTVSTTPAYINRTVNASPFNLTVPVRLDDLSPLQIVKLAEIHRLSYTDRELAALRSQVGGHPFLARLVIYEAKVRQKSLTQILSNDLSLSVFDPFLSHIRNTLLAGDLFDPLSRINVDPFTHISGAIYRRLSKAGLVCKEPGTGKLILRYAIYKRLFPD